MACKMWFGFQFNLSYSSDNDLYRIDLDPEGQGHQWKMISIQLGSYFGAPQKKNRAGGALVWDRTLTLTLTLTMTLTLTAVTEYVDPP